MAFENNFQLICCIWIGMAIIVFVLLQYTTAPFGRHTHTRWGWMVNNRLGWFMMELPSLLIMIYFLFFGSYSFSHFAWILFVLWIMHYLNRTIIFPLRIKSTQKKMPLMIVFSAIFFNFINAGLNGYYLAELAPEDKYSTLWFSAPHFYIGFCLFMMGMYMNIKSDQILINLRKNGDESYHIPEGFLFKYVSCPNLLGEIIEWIGFAVMAWNLPALSFALWTLANLLPRALKHHEWYLEKMEEYPVDRKAIIPFII